MNIYFSGIGGVGLGPLAEIALDAGHIVLGSDPKQGLMTAHLNERGVTINNDQSGAFLSESHAKRSIDWLVYTSALPADHPELVTAQALGIKISKRDELLAHIIIENNLKLIAVAGTHGKTTTTSLFVWAFQQLGIPISYSIGTTLSFGPSGKFDSKSEYFVYECDEYDRNFLQFHPHMAIIPSLSYDHPDTYPTEQDYLDAFRTFLGQSNASILWKDTSNLLGPIPRSLIIDENKVSRLSLAGDHVRRNASLVVKAFEQLGIDGDLTSTLNQFPGVDRRFEKLADNLYTDYAVHPKEIAATIAAAAEINPRVVTIYQPHQNVRQHAVKALYTHCFDKAESVYWLPTYLTREDASLPILSSEELTQQLTNQNNLHFADMNDKLWQDIEQARRDGSLVLVMGAGSIDSWIREQLNTA